MPQSLQTTLSFIVLLGVLVFVHELGHFLVAKWCGVKVLRFSIGFGPKLFGFTKGETEYQVALLPLGGYVKMAGDTPHEELPPEEAQRGFLAQPPWKRAAIVAAGPAFNLAFPVLVFLFVLWGTTQITSARVGVAEPGLPAAEAGLRPGDIVRAIDGQPVRGFEDITPLVRDRAGVPTVLLVERDGQPLQLSLTPARMVDTDVFGSSERGVIGVGDRGRAPNVGVPPGSPAHAAGLRTTDLVVAVNGAPVKTEAELEAAVAAAPAGSVAVRALRPRPLPVGPGVELGTLDVLEVKVDKPEGATARALGLDRVDLYVMRVEPGSPAARAGLAVGDRLESLDGKPLRSLMQLRVALDHREGAPMELGWRAGDGSEKKARLAQEKMAQGDGAVGRFEDWSLGVQLHEAPQAAVKPELITIHRGFGEALGRSLQIVPDFVVKMVQHIGLLLTRRFDSDQLGGPIMMFQLAGESSSQGLDSFLKLMALISINLGVMNLIPIPILDGFHLFTAAWEAVRRRPISVRAREIANVVGLAMLAMLMILVFYNDIQRLMRG